MLSLQNLDDNDIPRAAMEAADMTVLAVSREAGVHMAVSPDQFRMIYFQGHPEYDTHSLLKEFKREVKLYAAGERHRPPFPERYFPEEAARAAQRYLERADACRESGDKLPSGLDAEIEPYLDNTWGDTGKAIINNWLGLVYQLTNLDRRKLFMDGVDPENPLGLRA